jgi:endonuclease YncB( thermonuclease family)
LNISFWNNSTYASTEEWLWIEANDKDMSIIIPIKSHFPIKKSRIYNTRNSYQKRMEFEVYRWNDKLTKNNKFLWKFIIPELKPIKSVWARVEVIFDIQKDWKINFIAKDIKFPKNIINWYLDSEVDLLKKTNKNINKIKDNFQKIEKKVEKKLISESEKDNIKFLEIWEYKVEKVVDWDTFTFLLDWELVYTRMIWIDAPESSSIRYWYTEPFSKESTKFLKNKIEWKTVKLEYDKSQAKIDKYGRHLIYVFLNWENISNTMILEWFAKEYTYNKKYKYSDLFKKSENIAKNNKIWVWK